MYRNAQPMEAPNAFDNDSENAQLSQSAFLLGTALVMSGRADEVPDGEFLGIDRGALYGKGVPSYQDAINTRLEVDQAVIDEGRYEPALLRDKGAELASRTRDQAEPDDALALMAAATQSEHELVRVSAAAAATHVTGRHEPLVEVLATGLESEDDLVFDISATALARIDDQDPRLERFVGDDPDPGDLQPLTNTTFMTHGTWARRGTWWRPGGDFYEYINDHPNFTLHPQSFRWSGSYRHSRREVAALSMTNWIGQQNFAESPDVIAHSHGGTVAHLATWNEHGSQSFNNVILLSWPVHAEWFPRWNRVNHVYSFRVKYDLVIMADRGGQVLNPPPGQANMVTEEINGYFTHSDPHEEQYWEDHNLARHFP